MARVHCSRTARLTLGGLAMGIATIVCASSAQAGWHWHGSYGGYSSFGASSYSGGSWGGSGGGNWGSYGGSGGGSWGGSHGGRQHVGLLSRLHHRNRGSGSHGSSGGSWGSTGGSSGGYTSYYGSSGGHYGSSGGAVGYGSSGGGKVIYGSPVIPDADAPMNQQQLDPIPEIAPNANQGAIRVQVPEDALVYVNGILTKSVGAQRSYVSRGLVGGYQYTYEVRAEAIRDGKKVEETKTVQLKAGDNLSLAFNSLQSSQPRETSLTLKVPADAQVTLGGNPTHGTGELRVFSTTKLGSNNEWSNYIVQVTVERDGRTLTQEKNVTLKSGDSKTLAFDFDSAQVADAR